MGAEAFWMANKPVPKCFPMKNIIRGIRRNEIRFERVGNETADTRTSVTSSIVTASDHLRLTQEGNHENRKRGNYARVECFGFWLHQEYPGAGVIFEMRLGVILESPMKHTFYSND
jgi:hypothetical protein